MTEPRVLVYTKSWCGYCAKAKALLDKNGVAFEEVDLMQAPERFEEMIEKSGGNKTVPQIIIDGQPVGGCDDLFAYYKQHASIL